MSSVHRPSRPMRLSPDRIFYGSMAMAMIATVFVGFAPSYYMMRWTGAPALGPMVHVHGIAFTLWFLGFFAQTALISARRIDLHRAVGAGMVALAFIIVIVGTWVALNNEGVRPAAARDPRGFLLFPLTIMLLFVVYVTLGYRYRRRSEHHKRLMLLASIAMLVPAIARWGLPGAPGPLAGMIVSSFFLFAAWAYDGFRLGRVHPALAWGGLLLLVSFPFRWFFRRTEAWQALAELLIG